MPRFASALGLASAFALAVCSPATASQVTKQDLSGKKICWDSGLVSTYANGGEYTSGRLVGFLEASGHGL